MALVTKATDAREQSRGFAQVASGVVAVARRRGCIRLADDALQLRAFGCAAVDTIAVGRQLSGVTHSLLDVEQGRVPFGQKAEGAALYVAAGVAGGVVEG
ncbi:MAG: hypothetical protein C0509_06610, partial [Acinetobacter sp.]|nr:hypothetical protein [Acinetobacter sp.]